MDCITPGTTCVTRIVVDGEPDHANVTWDLIPTLGDALIFRNPYENGRRYLELRCPLCADTHSFPIDPYEANPGWQLISRDPLTVTPSIRVGPTHDGYTCHFTLTNGVFIAHGDSQPRPPRPQ